jgi:hypothetical protein
MELASMLAGEPFSDHPMSVSPVIAGFLRAYNDFVGDDLRRELYPVASTVVGSRAAPGIEKLRMRRVLEWGQNMRRARMGTVGAFLARTLTLDARMHPDGAGSFAVHAIGRRSRRIHPQVLALVDELVAYGRPDRGATGTLAGGPDNLQKTGASVL